MTLGPRLNGHGTVRLPPDRREQLGELVAAEGLRATARKLGVGLATLERALDSYARLSERTLRRFESLMDQLDRTRAAGVDAAPPEDLVRELGGLPALPRAAHPPLDATEFSVRRAEQIEVLEAIERGELLEIPIVDVVALKPKGGE